MAFLNAFVEDARMDLLVGVQDKKEYVKTLVDALLSTAASLESGQYKHIYIYIYILLFMNDFRCPFPGFCALRGGNRVEK